MTRALPTPEHALASLKRRMAKYSRVTESGCVEWTGHTTRGYGYIAFWLGDRAKYLRAHRVAYALHHGLHPVFEGVIRHSCDSPACVNPAHLALGTQADNMTDKTLKGRNQFGSRCTYAKLDEDKVQAIRRDERPQSVIAEDYGLVQQTVSDIKRRRIWKHVA